MPVDDAVAFAVKVEPAQHTGFARSRSGCAAPLRPASAPGVLAGTRDLCSFADGMA